MIAWAVAAFTSLLAVIFFLKWLDLWSEVDENKGKTECPWDECKGLIKNGGMARLGAYQTNVAFSCPICENSIFWDNSKYVRVLKENK